MYLYCTNMSSDEEADLPKLVKRCVLTIELLLVSDIHRHIMLCLFL